MNTKKQHFKCEILLLLFSFPYSLDRVLPEIMR